MFVSNQERDNYNMEMVKISFLLKNKKLVKRWYNIESGFGNKERPSRFSQGSSLNFPK